MLSERINLLTEQFISYFKDLSEEQLNRKPAKDRWSIGQCIDHVINTNDKYIIKLRELLSDKHRMTFWEKFNPTTDYTGRNMIKTLGPQVIKKFRAPKLFLPTHKKISADILDKFKIRQDELSRIVKSIEAKNLLQKVITSPVAGLITLRVKDAIQLIIVHEERHLQQALRVMESE